MTMQSYPSGWAAGSKDPGGAGGVSSSFAWGANLNNGNVNNNHRNNRGFGLAVARAGEFQGAVTLEDLFKAFQRARRGKKPSADQAQFEESWMENLLQLRDEINTGTWNPRPCTCFIATRNKAREIHAPAFADRVVHQLVIPKLETYWERRFIHDSYANRIGKGSHAAVRRVTQYFRQVQNAHGGGWYLQLDVANFFNSIDRRLLWEDLRRGMARAGTSTQIQRVIHALIRRSPLAAGVHLRASSEEVALVPLHKRLSNSPKGYGLPIGNLSSQFFANVFLDRLDQFVKHTLKARRYARYVDDFVLVSHDREELVAQHRAIEAFLERELHLRLKADVRLRRLEDGLDFLGYIIRPTHTLVRRRVVAHLREAVATWETGHVQGRRIHASPAELRELQAKIASFAGHLRHANSGKLRRSLHRRFPWVATAAQSRRANHRLEGRRLTIHHRGKT